ncbi:MAG: Lrp/AsnC family transcriptional regulator [Candidatus Omnitrophota bacterium]|nr:Lrp/AsnC family transcriptional regulator [Candidatus Omnitrophota bacterium]
MKTKLNLIDKRILNRLQKDIPFVKRPWEAVAEELNIKEDLLIKRVGLLKKKGLIRRVSAGFNPRRVGFVSTLIAAKIGPQYLNKAARKINFYPEVTHNYGRDSEYNLWFTLVAKNKKRIAQIVNQIKKDKNIEAILELPAVKLFKIDVNFRV